MSLIAEPLAPALACGAATAWTDVCALDAILPGTGVCALVAGRPIAVFRLGDQRPRLFAIDNIDPNSGASVLSRGLMGNLGDRMVVASPLYKHHFDLVTGECLESPAHSVRAWPVRAEGGRVLLAA